MRAQAEVQRRQRQAEWEAARPLALQEYLRRPNLDRLEKLARAHARGHAGSYADALQESSGGAGSGAELERWAEFARQKANGLDPLRRPTQLEFVEPEDVPGYKLNSFMPPGVSYSRPPGEAR